jgi:hypothetical protein
MKLVVAASDNYIDAVPLFFRAMEKFWHDCPYRRELIYCGTPPDFTGLNVPLNGIVKLGKDDGWIESMIKYTDTPFGNEGPFMLMLEDYLVCDSNTALVELAAKKFVDPLVDMVRIRATPGPTLPWPCDGIGQIDMREPYAASLQAAMWRPSAFSAILHAVYDAGGRSAWDFEIKGSDIAASLGLGYFLGLEDSGVSYKNLYRRGKKVSEVAEWAKANL